MEDFFQRAHLSILACIRWCGKLELFSKASIVLACCIKPFASCLTLSGASNLQASCLMCVSCHVDAYMYLSVLRVNNILAYIQQLPSVGEE